MWLIVAVAGFFFLAIAAASDKFVLTKSRIVPVSYAFYVCALGGMISSVMLFFGGFSVPQGWVIWAPLLGAGVSFYLGLYFVYRAVREHEVSRVTPLVISLTPLAVLVFSLMLGLGSVGWMHMLGAGLLLVGSYFLSQVGAQRNQLEGLKTWAPIILAVLMFALTNTLSKVIYNQIDFVNAFVWIRWVSLVGAVIGTTVMNGWGEVFYRPAPAVGEWQKIYRRVKCLAQHYTARLLSPICDLENYWQKKERRGWVVLLIGQSAGALGTVLVQYAIKLGNVFLVTALNGLQFFFIIVLMYLLTRFWPKVLKEDGRQGSVAQKILWSCVLILGMAFIVW